ncbi:MAG: YihY/virulence factor BrkB family protein [Geminicoccales bacterium]
MRRPVQLLWLLKQALIEFQRDNAALFGAAIAFYTFFSLSPMLVIIIAVAGLAYGDAAAEGRVVDEVSRYIGRQSAEALQHLLANARPSSESLAASALGLLTMFFGATRAFGSLKAALETMWKFGESSSRSLLTQLALSRLLSFLMVLVVGTLLLLLLAAGAVVAALDNFVPGWISDGTFAYFLRCLEIAISIVSAAVLFALIYRVLPEARIEWSDVWLGSFTAAILFTAGKSVIGWYLGRGSLSSLFGAAGSLVVLMLWVYYSAQILLFGAEVTEVYAKRWGSYGRRARESAG